MSIFLCIAPVVVYLCVCLLSPSSFGVKIHHSSFALCLSGALVFDCFLVCIFLQFIPSSSFNRVSVWFVVTVKTLARIPLEGVWPTGRSRSLLACCVSQYTVSQGGLLRTPHLCESFFVILMPCLIFFREFDVFLENFEFPRISVHHKRKWFRY